MKLKEKLAKEYAEEHGDFGDGPQSDAWLGFLAGFEKAKELFGRSAVTFSEMVSDIGEEEV